MAPEGKIKSPHQKRARNRRRVAAGVVAPLTLAFVGMADPAAALTRNAGAVDSYNFLTDLIVLDLFGGDKGDGKKEEPKKEEPPKNGNGGNGGNGDVVCGVDVDNASQGERSWIAVIEDDEVYVGVRRVNQDDVDEYVWDSATDDNANSPSNVCGIGVFAAGPGQPPGVQATVVVVTEDGELFETTCTQGVAMGGNTTITCDAPWANVNEPV
ncbi:hypothetical protein [Allostreptomyces psammosilenae]|uniref:Uncharacterized protein n=1 Tax=Allostreptomyces psammosilenae TaxID=1892865 RepID=A0A853A049_9ACTN|nr:hypothetical protein [Allostreptomyces psammosilenae]NYI06304.1 hypothetical protein [Allostreptomyces psammosilenae]